jgi:hypothetical protein
MRSDSHLKLKSKKSMPFLDVVINMKENTFKTKVYTKPTNHGDCLNYNSVCPDRYKAIVVQAFLYRGYHVSSDWAQFSFEIERIKQL